MKTKSCEQCVNRLVCPTRRTEKPLDICDGYNNEKVFAGLCSFAFSVNKEKAQRTLEFIKVLQSGK